MQKINFDKRIVVICDCLDSNKTNDSTNIHDFVMDNSDLRERVTVQNTNGPLTTFAFLSDRFTEAIENKDKQYLFILQSAHEMMYMSTLLANAQMENRLDDYPVIDASEIGVYDVYNYDLVVPLIQDGFIRECGFDSTMKILMNDYIRLQTLNKPSGPSVELGGPSEQTAELGDMPEDFVSDRVQKVGDAVDELESVQDVIQKRKAK